MGFRDLFSFNKALLAKQCWRLVQNLESLAATIIKEKYFRRGNFFTATLGYGELGMGGWLLYGATSGFQDTLLLLSSHLAKSSQTRH